MQLPSIYMSQKTFSNEKTYRDGIPKKQTNKVGKNDTTVPLRTPIPISFDNFQQGVLLVTWNDRMLDRDRELLMATCQSHLSLQLLTWLV